MYSISKISFLSVFLFLSATNISFSQTEEGQDTGSNSSSQYLQVSFINETALYYHSCLNDKLSLRSGLSAHWDYDEGKDGEGNRVSQSTYHPIDNQKYESNSLHNNYEVIFSSLLFYRFNDYKYAKIYMGFGPSLSYSLDKSTQYSSYSTDSTYSKYNYGSNSTRIGFGPSISLLIKCQLYGSLSLVSEYNFTAYYTWRTDNNNSRNDEKYEGRIPSFSNYEYHQKSKGWKLNLSKVRVGLLIAL